MAKKRIAIGVGVAVQAGCVHNRATPEQKAVWPTEWDRRDVWKGTVTARGAGKKQWQVALDVGTVTLHRNTLSLLKRPPEKSAVSTVAEDVGASDPPPDALAEDDAARCANPPSGTAAAAAKAFKMLSRDEMLAAKKVEIPYDKAGGKITWSVLPEGEEITKDVREDHLAEQEEQLAKLAASLDEDMGLDELFFKHGFPDITDISDQFNAYLDRFQPNAKKRKVRLTDDDVKLCLLLVLAATEEAEVGVENLFSSEKLGRHDPPDFQRYVQKNTFKAFLSALPFVWTEPEAWGRLSTFGKGTWEDFQPVLDHFNQHRFRVGDDELWKVWEVCVDESMSGWRPKSTKTGGLPHLTAEPRKPVPLGTFWVPTRARSKFEPEHA